MVIFLRILHNAPMTTPHAGAKKPPRWAAERVEMDKDLSALAPAQRGVLGHHINDVRNFGDANSDAIWREAIFGSKIGKKLGEDDLMLQWLYLACVLRPQPPSLKGYLKRLILKVAFAVRSIFDPRHRNGGDGANNDAAKSEQAVNNRRVKAHNIPFDYIRPDADYFVRIDQDGSDFW